MAGISYTSWSMLPDSVKTLMSIILKYVPLGMGILIIVIGSFFVPWHEVTPYIRNMHFDTIIALLALGLAYYFSRIFRFGYILRTLGQPLPIGRLTIAYFVAQPVSLLPAGELYRSVMLKKHGNVSMSYGVPSVFMQSLTEGLGLVVIALISALILHRYIILVGVIAVIYIMLLVMIHRQNVRKSHRLVNKLPIIDISHYRVRTFIKKIREVLSGSSLVVLILTSFISTFAATAALFIAAQSFGVEINFVQAIIAFALPMVLQAVTFLPGGLGVNEQGSVGILLLLDVSLAPAVAITLVVRFITLGLGLILGCIAIAYTKISKYEKS